MASSGDTFCVRNSLLCLAPLVRHPLLSKSHPQGALRQLLTSSGGKSARRGWRRAPRSSGAARHGESPNTKEGDLRNPPGKIPGPLWKKSEINLEKFRTPFGKIPANVWKNSKLVLEKFRISEFSRCPRPRAHSAPKN